MIHTKFNICLLLGVIWVMPWASPNCYSQQWDPSISTSGFSQAPTIQFPAPTTAGLVSGPDSSVVQAQATFPVTGIQNAPASTAAGSNQNWSRPISSFVDPRTGIVYDRFIESEQVPTQRWETEEKMERRWVPELVTENRQITQVEHVPVVSYQSQSNNGAWWNPFSSGQASSQLVPKVDYVPVNRVVTAPVQVQRYVERDIPVRVPKLVQATESRAKYVDRPRSGQRMGQSASGVLGANPTASGVQQPYVFQPVYPNSVANSAMTMNNQIPLGYNPGSIGVPAPTFSMRPPMAGLQAYPVSPVIAPTSPYSASTNNQFAANPAMGQSNPPVDRSVNVLPATSPNANVQTPMVPVNASYRALSQNSTTPLMQWPSWLGGNGPLIKRSLFRENKLLPVGVGSSSIASVSSPSIGFGGPVGYAYQQPVLPNTQTGLQMNPIFNSSVASSTQPLAGTMTIQPTTNTVFPNRTATQMGMPATQLR